MKKENQSKQVSAKTAGVYQSNTPTKRQKWILINKDEGKISGMLDHQAFNTRESAKEWFQRTSSISGETIKISDFYYVLKAEEYEFLKELDVLDIIADQDIN